MEALYREPVEWTFEPPMVFESAGMDLYMLLVGYAISGLLLVTLLAFLHVAGRLTGGQRGQLVAAVAERCIGCVKKFGCWLGGETFETGIVLLFTAALPCFL